MGYTTHYYGLYNSLLWVVEYWPMKRKTSTVKTGKTHYKTYLLTNKADCKGAVRPCDPDFISFFSERNEAKNAAAVPASHGKTRPCEA